MLQSTTLYLFCLWTLKLVYFHNVSAQLGRSLVLSLSFCTVEEDRREVSRGTYFARNKSRVE